MGSQTDLDQGGTFRQYAPVYLGPSVGWIWFPVNAQLVVSAAGAQAISRGTNLIQVNFNGAVTINLPSSKASTQGPGVIPGQAVYVPTIICDIGGFATANPVTINPAAGETISGLNTVSLAVNFGTVLLNPLLTSGGWTLGQ
jgi:hypothetical protein